MDFIVVVVLSGIFFHVCVLKLSTAREFLLYGPNKYSSPIEQANANTCCGLRENPNCMLLALGGHSRCECFQVLSYKSYTSRVKHKYSMRNKYCFRLLLTAWFWFLIKRKRKGNITVEFVKNFESVCKQKVADNDIRPRVVCNTWKYRVKSA